MIRIVSPHNKEDSQELLQKLFRFRYRVAVQQWGWRLPDARDGYDIDQFDRESTVHFINIDDVTGKIIACGRMNPSTLPTLLSEVFPNACDIRPVPMDPLAWEFSRFLTESKDLDRKAKLMATGRISLAVTEFAVMAGIQSLVWIAPEETYRKGQAIWKTRPLGKPQYYADDDMVYIPGVSAATADSVARQKRLFRCSGLSSPDLENFPFESLSLTTERIERLRA